MKDIVEKLNDELTDAINSLEIEEGEDEQEKLVSMITDLQLKAFTKGLEMGHSGASGQTDEMVVSLDDDGIKGLVVALMEGRGISFRLQPASDN
jgi:hypothetical protein